MGQLVTHWPVYHSMRVLYILTALLSTPLQCKKKMKESTIYNIKLPPEPYKFLAGMGFVSENTNFARTALQSILKGLDEGPGDDADSKKEGTLITLPVNFVLNGRPFGLTAQNSNGTIDKAQEIVKNS